MNAAPELVEKVKSVIVDVLRIDQGKIHLNSRFTEDLGADSLDRVTLLMALEDEFGRSISDEEASTFTNVEAVVNFISSKARESASC